MTADASLNLSFDLTLTDLYETAGLAKVDAAFLDWLGDVDKDLRVQLTDARANVTGSDSSPYADLMIALAPHLEDFLARLFGVEAELGALAERHHDLAPLFTCKRLFVQRIAVKKFKADEAETLDGDALAQAFGEAIGSEFDGDELVFARAVTAWQQAAEDDADAHEGDLDVAARYAAWATLTPAGRARHGHGVLFQVPGKVDSDHLVPIEGGELDGLDGSISYHRLGEEHLRRREGFALTDQGCDLVGALDHANYCIFCHNQGKDSCARGLREKVARDAPEGTIGAFKASPFGVTLAGCPLDERISEMHLVKTQGYALGALAIIAVDNPLCAATGHRICNDCMKSCIYQRQDPVNIPQAETRTLKDVLDLPWGFEIYGLMTRWNPLNVFRPLPLPATGKRVLVAGLGPAGFSLAHNLMNDGHVVAGIDGLKIEPLPEDLSGVATDGSRVPFRPIRDIEDLYEELGERVMAGFGGVAEYGITVRWNKNFLKIIRLLLERRHQFTMMGGVRFGTTLTVDGAFERGFDHIALAVGAGKPTVLDMPGGLARGVRTASDFLMALQLTGAARTDTLANMQLRLPVVVIGGGLTAIDTATEALAYYTVQVEKFLQRWETLAGELGEDAVRAAYFMPEEADIADEFLTHARAIREERNRAEAVGEAPKILELLNGWGGVTLCYRKRMLDAPSYTLNHEEIEKALEEGIRFAELLSPVEVNVDDTGHAESVRFARQIRDEDGRFGAEGAEVTLPARAVLVAAGTTPNTVLAREDAESVHLDGKFFQAIDEDGNPVTPERVKKPNEVQILASKRDDGRYVSFFGDLHPSYAGNVVSAMASGKQGYPVVSKILDRISPFSEMDDKAFLDDFNDDMRAHVHEVIRLTPTIVEVVVRAPAAARNFNPGQFYRLQNFETIAKTYDDTTLAMEGIALTGAWVDKEEGLIGLIVLEMGGSSDLCAYLEPGEPVIVMGPTGMPTETPGGETVLLAGGGLGNAVLFSIGQAFRAAGSKVLYFAGYKAVIDRYKVEDIEAAADVIVWCCDEAPGFEPNRPQDHTFVGNIVQCMQAYASGELGEQAIKMSDVDRVVAIGSDRMMAAVGQSRHEVLKPFLKAEHVAVGSINSPMQCMMKEICAQCLQPHRDPVTGERSVVFSCFNQDQELDLVDFAGLNSRLRQNAVQEKLTALWIDRCLAGLESRPLRRSA